MTAFKCDTKYRSYQEMLKQKDMDAVAIFRPVPMHAWMVHGVRPAAAGATEQAAKATRQNLTHPRPLT